MFRGYYFSGSFNERHFDIRGYLMLCFSGDFKLIYSCDFICILFYHFKLSIHLLSASKRKNGEIKRYKERETERQRGKAKQ